MLKFITSLLPKKATWSRWRPNIRLGYIATFLVVLTTTAGILTGIFSLGKKIIIKNPNIKNEQIFHLKNSFRILIIPFKEFYKTSGLDVGKVLKSRFDEKKIEDSLNIEVFYLEDLVPSGNFNEDSANAQMEKYDANLVIFGDYISPRQPGEKDMVILNFNSTTAFTAGSLNYNPVGTSFQELKSGQLQGEIDYCIYFFAGESMFDQGDYHKCISYLSKIETKYYKTLTYFTKILSFLQIQEFDSANYYSDLFIESYPDDMLSYSSKLLSLIGIKDSSGSKSIINKLLDLDLKDSEERNAIIILYYTAMDDTTNLRHFINQLIDSNPYRCEYYISRASLSFGTDEALKDLEMAIRYDSTGYSYYSRAMHYIAIDSTNKAINDLTKSIMKGYKAPISFFERAKLYYQIGEHKKALKDLNRILTEDNLTIVEQILTYRLRADIYGEIGENGKAEKDYQKITELEQIGQ